MNPEFDFSGETAIVTGAARGIGNVGSPGAHSGDGTEIVPGVLFLASPDAGFITGAVLPVDGGISI